MTGQEATVIDIGKEAAAYNAIKASIPTNPSWR
jgi:hypothetical protein